MTPEFAIVQALLLPLALGILTVVIIWCYRNPSKWLYALGMVIWMLHSIAFYGVVIYWNFIGHNPAPSIFLTNWSVVLRAHGYITLLSTGIAFLQHGGPRGSHRTKGS